MNIQEDLKVKSLAIDKTIQDLHDIGLGLELEDQLGLSFREDLNKLLLKDESEDDLFEKIKKIYQFENEKLEEIEKEIWQEESEHFRLDQKLEQLKQNQSVFLELNEKVLDLD